MEKDDPRMKEANMVIQKELSKALKRVVHKSRYKIKQRWPKEFGNREFEVAIQFKIKWQGDDGERPVHSTKQA
jgi:hypothetical protein